MNVSNHPHKFNPTYDHYQKRLEPFVKDYKKHSQLPLAVYENSLKNKIHPEDYVVVAPFGKAKERFWDADNWLGLLKQIPAHTQIYLIGSKNKDEVEYLNRIKQKLDRVEIFAGTITFTEIAELLKHSRYFLGLDNGLSHLAYQFCDAGAVFYTNVLPRTRIPDHLIEKNWLTFYGGKFCEMSPCQDTTKKTKCRQKGAARFSCCAPLTSSEQRKIMDHIKLHNHGVQ